MWVVERPGGGRGFGFTGGHFHDNWGNDEFRKVVLNAILWTAHAEVPQNGVPSAITQDDLDANLDPKPSR
jgi:type 1 glutamine amidotransferase